MKRHGRRLTFEYSLVQGVNDNLDEARKLSSLIKDMHGHVNDPCESHQGQDYRQSGRGRPSTPSHTYLEKAGDQCDGPPGDGPRHRRRLRAAEKKLSEKGRGRESDEFLWPDSTPAGCGSRIGIRSFCPKLPVGPLSNLFMVADGMGGHKAGDFASRFVVDTMVRCMGLYKKR